MVDLNSTPTGPAAGHVYITVLDDDKYPVQIERPYKWRYRGLAITETYYADNRQEYRHRKEYTLTHISGIGFPAWRIFGNATTALQGGHTRPSIQKIKDQLKALDLPDLSNVGPREAGTILKQHLPK